MCDSSKVGQLAKSDRQLNCRPTKLSDKVAQLCCVSDIGLIPPETRVPACRRFAALTICVYLARNYFRKSHCRKLDKPARKQNLTRNSQSGSFKVTHFAISEKPTRNSGSLYNNADLTSKVSLEIASENAENCRCRQPHCRLTLPNQGTPANIRQTLR